ncbi:MAG: alpha/beta hydrolase, partial [Planctomycetota bacterium]
MSDDQAQDETPTPRRRRWLPRWWQVYLVLLIASFLVQLRSDGPGPIPAGYESIELQTQRRDGPAEVKPLGNSERPITVTPETITLAYQDAGPKDGPVIVLLHGSPGDSSNFAMTDNGLIETLADEGYRVIAPDMPGFGYSEPYVPDYSNRAHARYVQDLLDQLGIDSAHFLAFSMGGGVVINLYDLNPERIQSITMRAA